MSCTHEMDFGTSAERLKTLLNLLELAQHAPDGEVTDDGKVALQITARQISVLSAEIGIATPG